MKLELLTTLSQFEALEPEWSALLKRNPINEIFLTWQWQYTWWSHYQPGALWIVTARDEIDALVGLASWYVDGTTGVLMPIGGRDVTDYLDLLATPEQCAEFYAAFSAFLIDHRAAYTSILFCNVPAESPGLSVLAARLEEYGFSVNVQHEDVCPFIALPNTFEVYLEGLDKKDRHEIRRKLRRAEEGDDDTVESYVVNAASIANGTHDLAVETEQFLSLMAASQPDKAEFLQRDGGTHAQFFRILTQRMADSGWLHLTFLKVNGEVAAAYFNFDYDNRILVYNSGLLSQKYAYLSPGIVLLTQNIRSAIEQGRAVFDFLQGNESYKYRMGAQDRRVMVLEAYPPQA